MHATKIYIAECVPAEQKKLSTSHANITKDIQILQAEFKTMMDDSRKAQAATMQGYIRKAISANTQSLTSAGTSPFVTKTEMVSIFAEFKSKLHTMFHPPPPTAHMTLTAKPPPYGAYGFPASYLARLHQEQSELPHPAPTPTVTPPHKKSRDHSPDHSHEDPNDTDVEFYDASNDRPDQSTHPVGLLMGTQPLPTHHPSRPLTATTQQLPGGATV
jgi:hypothetical protein